MLLEEVGANWVEEHGTNPPVITNGIASSEGVADEICHVIEVAQDRASLGWRGVGGIGAADGELLRKGLTQKLEAMLCNIK